MYKVILLVNKVVKYRKLNVLFFSLCRKIEIWEYILHAEIILVGLVGGIASTYSVIADLANADHPSFTVPCYVNATASGG